jgi:NADH:ubiquinone oxidoreductase subunit 6 (subunit J)
VMMLNIKILELDETFWKYLPIGLFISSIFLFQILFMIFDLDWIDFLTVNYESFFVKKVNFLNTNLNNSSVSPNDLKVLYDHSFIVMVKKSSFYNNMLPFSLEFTNTELLGWLVYTYTFFVFLVISLILLIAMVGSIVLVLNQNINVKRQLIFKQTLKNLKSSVVLKN